MYYKLADVIDTPQKLNVVAMVDKNGSKYRKYCMIRLIPGEKYAVTDDSVLMESLRSITTKVKYSSDVEDALKASGVPYTVKACPSCGGRVKKIEYHVVQFVED